MITGPLLRAMAHVLAVLLLLVAALPASAEVLRAEEAFRLSATRTADGILALGWRIAPGTYLYRESLKARIDGRHVALATDPGEMKDDPNFGLVEVYHGEAAAQAAGLPGQGMIAVSFQGCAAAGICYPVVTRQVDLATLAVAAPPASVPAGGASAGAKGQPARVVTAASASTSGETGVPDAERPLVRAISTPSASVSVPAQAVPAPAASVWGEAVIAGAKGPPTQVEAPAAAPAAGRAEQGAMSALLDGNIAALLAAFFGFGLLLAFTPCVFPMLPILSGILAGGETKPSPLRGFALSATYGLAMAAAYGLLGLVAAWSGANLQAALQTPWALGLMAAVFTVLAASMLGLFDMTVPAALAARLQRGGGGSIAGAAMLGFGAALVVGPCVTPPLAGALLYAAQTGDAVRGGAALFLLGLGMAAPLVAVGTFGAQILPRSGPWLARVKQASGGLFLAVAAVLLARLLPDAAGLALFGLLAIGLGVYLGAFDRLDRDSAGAARLGKTTGIASLVYGITLLVGAAGGAGDPARPLGFLAASARSAAEAPREVRVSSPDALAAALAEAGAGGRPVLVSFTATWCTVCRSNEAVMAEPAVVARLAGVARIAADVTAYGDGERALMARYDVIGTPTLLLLDAAGAEIPGSRRIGALGAADIDSLAAQAGL